MTMMQGILLALTVLTLSESACTDKQIECICGNTNTTVSISCNGMKPSIENPCQFFERCDTCKDNVQHCVTCPKGSKGLLCDEEDESFPTKSRRFPRGTRRIARREVPCHRLKSPKAGAIRCSYSSYSSECTASCIPGFFFENYDSEIKVECINGRWTPMAVFPPCKSGGSCDLEIRGAGSFNCTYGMHGTWCDVRCQGPNRRYECFPGHHWRPSLPSCVREKGLQKTEPEDCACQNGGTCDRATQRCNCPPDFRGRYCETSQRRVQPVAEPCPDPGLVTNGDRMNSDGTLIPPNHVFYPGSVVVYDCKRGFALLGKSLLTCTESRRWSSEPPTCNRIPQRRSTTTTTTESPPEIVYCNDPGEITNGQRLLIPWLGARNLLHETAKEKYPQGFQIEYSCKKGYTLVGGSSLICLITGAWSTSLPSCKQTPKGTDDVVYCANPGRIANGKRLVIPPINERKQSEFFQDPPEFPIGTKLLFNCDDGFSLRDCGRSFNQSRRKITHGERTLEGDWPWQVAITEFKDGKLSVFCGGVLINPSTVVTAAHCVIDVQPEKIFLYFGKHYLDFQKDDQEVSVRTPLNFITHPNFNSRTLDADITLIKFSPEIQYSARVQPICLPSPENTRQDLVIGSSGLVIGWGETENGTHPDVLLMAEIPVVPTGVCREYYQQKGVRFQLTRNMFCGGYKAGKVDSCRGDSGGPMMFFDDEARRYVLEGLVSFGVTRNCGQPEWYAIYVKVGNFVRWIKQNS